MSDKNLMAQRGFSPEPHTLRRLLQGYSPFAMTTKANATPKRLRFGMAEPTSHAPANDKY